MALAMLGSTFSVPAYAGYGSINDIEAQRAIELANKAVSFGPNIDFVFQARAVVKIFLFGDLAGAKIDCERALKINPYFHSPQYVVAMIEILNGNTDIGIEQLIKCLKAVPDDPTVPISNSVVAIGHLISGENDKALQFAKEGYDLRPSLPICAVVYAVAASSNPEITDSENFKSMNRQLDLRSAIIKNLPFTRAKDVELLNSRLRKAGIPD